VVDGDVAELVELDGPGAPAGCGSEVSGAFRVSRWNDVLESFALLLCAGDVDFRDTGTVQAVGRFLEPGPVTADEPYDVRPVKSWVTCRSCLLAR
jgi:hypothetical protein